MNNFKFFRNRTFDPINRDFLVKYIIKQRCRRNLLIFDNPYFFNSDVSITLTNWYKVIGINTVIHIKYKLNIGFSEPLYGVATIPENEFYSITSNERV